jgi:hypothetical protein
MHKMNYKNAIHLCDRLCALNLRYTDKYTNKYTKVT